MSVAGESDELTALSQFLRGITEPIAEAQKVQATEQTRQIEVQVEAEVTRHRYTLFFAAFIVAAVLAFAILALVTGSKDVAEKVVIAAVAFAGGYGAARAGSR